jgi:hypothetical protein
MARPLVMLGFLVPALAGAVPASAQRWDRPIRRMIDHYYSVELGLIGGVNRNTLTNAGPIDSRYRGFGGAFVSVPLATRSFRVRPELLVSGKQFRQPAAGTDGTVQSFTWLELPVLFEARFRHALGRDLTPRLFAGPFVAVRLACSTISPASQPNGAKLVQDCEDVPPGGTFNNGDAGFVLGAGLGAGPVAIGFRWNRSLVPVAPSGSAAGALAGAKQSTLALTLEVTTRLR